VFDSFKAVGLRNQHRPLLSTRISDEYGCGIYFSISMLRRDDVRFRDAIPEGEKNLDSAPGLQEVEGCILSTMFYEVAFCAMSSKPLA
jgi:hypothetical protein